MKIKFKILCIGITLIGAAATGNAQGLLTFDDLTAGPPLPNGYGGLNWQNFGVEDGLAMPATYGYHTGMISPSNVAFNRLGQPASITVSGGLFDLDSAYLTAALNFDTPLDIEVQGFVGTTLLYDNTYIVNRSAPSLINFDYVGVNKVTFISSPAQEFAMDNLTFAVPEPSTYALVSVATVLGGFHVWRKKIKNCGHR